MAATVLRYRRAVLFSAKVDGKSIIKRIYEGRMSHLPDVFPRHEVRRVVSEHGAIPIPQGSTDGSRDDPCFPGLVGVTEW